ncbi:MAG: YiiX/YebB-like N1pC/P60 family cysteine hydrolase [Isosphaeraceae bacterium]
MPLGSGCRIATQNTDLMVPRGWRGNAWGPKANAARASGEIPDVPSNPDMLAWDAWGRTHLRDGDIVFRMGDARAAFGLLRFSKISASIADSRFSHCGIVALENGAPVVYDTSTSGPQRQPFSVWILDADGNFAVKRPRPEYAEAANKAVAYCRSIYRAETPYDWGMKLGDDELYCIEMTERAYQVAGLPLSRPVRIDELPRYKEHPWSVRLIKLGSKMVPQQLAYVIGNEKYGIWANPSLDLVYEANHTKPPMGPGDTPGISPLDPSSRMLVLQPPAGTAPSPAGTTPAPPSLATGVPPAPAPTRTRR